MDGAAPQGIAPFLEMAFSYTETLRRSHATSVPPWSAFWEPGGSDWHGSAALVAPGGTGAGEPPALPGMGHVKPFEGHGPLPKKPHPALPFLPHSRFA